VNLAIHLANTLLLFALAMLALQAPRVRASALSRSAPSVAFLAAALFATHPLGTQAVSYVVQRMASLTALFYLLAVVLFVAWRLGRDTSAGATRGRLLYLGLLVASLLAFRTKEHSFTLPVTLLLAELLLFDGTGRRRFLPIVPVALLSLIIPATLLLATGATAGVADRLGSATRVDTPVSRGDYFRTELVVVVDYLRLLLFPSGQSLDHDVPIRRALLEPHVLLSAALLGTLAALGGWLAWRARPREDDASRMDPAASLAAFGIAWFFVTLSVESSVIPIADVMNEHRAYLPSMGIFLAVATGLGLALRRLAGAAAPRATVLVGVAIALVLASLTLRRNAVWASEITLWTDAAEKAPGKFRPAFNLGTALVAAGRFDEATQALRRAAAIDPESAAARAQLGAVLLNTGRLGEAEPELRAAVRLAPSDPEALMNLAQTLLRSGRPDEAKEHLRRFLEVAPPSYAGPRKVAESILAR
jgi:tetratricopeptide (TPR) repeat protein